MNDHIYPYWRVRVIVEKCTGAGDGLIFAKETNAINSKVKGLIKEKTAALDLQYRIIESYKESQS